MLARVDNTWAAPTHPGTLTASFQGKDIFPPSRAFPSSLAEDGILLARGSCIRQGAPAQDVGGQDHRGDR